MSKIFDVPIWKSAPFIRLLLPLVTGILLQWYLHFSIEFIVTASISFTAANLLVYLLPLSLRFKLALLQGLLINLLLITFGLLLTWQKDIRHNKDWFGNYYQYSDYLAVRINEPLVEKAKSYKADGVVEYLISSDTIIKCDGKILLYFSKDSIAPPLHYGDIVLISKKLQGIKNSGNPGAFNYERYAAFQ